VFKNTNGDELDDKLTDEFPGGPKLFNHSDNRVLAISDFE
jgi:hypothetical protein